MLKEELQLVKFISDLYSYELVHKETLSLIFKQLKIIFQNCLIFKMGYPNEEIYMHYEHYSQQSMHKYILYQIIDSDWIKDLNEVNKVHPRHSNKIMDNYRHFILLFEDEVFECIAISVDFEMG